MSDTPRTDSEAFLPHDSKEKVCDSDFARTLERELKAANAEIEEKRKDVVWLATEKAKLEERIKRLEAVVNDPHALWTNWLRGDVKLPVGIGDVRQYQDCIKRLEEAGDKLHWAWMNPFDPAGETIVDNWDKAKEDKP